MCIRGLQRECAERAGANGTREYTIEEIDERKSENGISLEKKNPKKKKKRYNTKCKHMFPYKPLND